MQSSSYNPNDKMYDSVLVGSGPSAVTFLYYLNNKKKITVIDCGLTKNSKLEKKDDYQNLRINKKNLFSVNNFKKINNIVANNFKIIGSMAKGGLSIFQQIMIKLKTVIG